MDKPTDRNRLDAEASPYLQQHADNPVNWQPWDDAALDAARERDVPIFLSVGYAACHWCHVMEEESFEDEAVAAVLNERFVPIKVDREERPDLDSIYQTACQLVSGRGGWPLSAWLTPEGEPFYVGTYFPRESGRGMPGFLDLLEDLAESWEDPEERTELENRAERIATRIRDDLEQTGDPTRPDPAADVGDGDAADVLGEADDEGPSPLERTANAAVRSADREHGGWGQGPKFPQPARIEALFDAGADAVAGAGAADGDVGDGDAGDGSAGEGDGDGAAFHAVANAALAAMVDGGLYDHVGGGFHRYCTDRDWTVPHFEKMLYDNAEIPRVLVAAHQRTGHDRYATVARETFDFLDRELAHDGGRRSGATPTSSDEHPEFDGGFAATLDARSPIPADRTPDGEPGEDEEGAFYVWTPAEIAEALDDAAEPGDPDLVALVCDRYGITEQGNFEGRTVLTVETSIEDLAAEYDLDPATVREYLGDARERLRAVRERRPRPRRDDKVIAAWNGLAIRALAEGSIALEDDALADRAIAALDAVRSRLWDGERLARRYVPETGDGEGVGDHRGNAAGDDGPAVVGADVQGVGYLEDYAFLGRGALSCYEATGDVEPLAFALDLGDAIVEAFYDDERGTLYATPAGGEELIARPQEPRDQSTPSSLAVGADLLLALDAFRSDDRFERAARRVCSTHASRLETRPLEHPSLALATERARAGSTEVTIAAAGLPDRWRSWLADRYLPRRLLAPRPPTAAGLADWLDRLGLEAAPPIWAGREPGEAEGEEDGTTAYVCRNFTCSRPLSDPAEADEWLDA